uniref:Uncharacterized protein n=1 Tax=Tymovirales sp. TaxID=1955157 RepID=A0A8S5VWP6_9VIRU|nr:MAG TPA: hypothetical protein [Tymovirales sp.]
MPLLSCCQLASTSKIATTNLLLETTCTVCLLVANTKTAPKRYLIFHNSSHTFILETN